MEAEGGEAQRWYDGVAEDESWTTTLGHGAVEGARGAVEGAVNGLVGGAAGAVSTRIAGGIARAGTQQGARLLGRVGMQRAAEFGTRMTVDAGLSLGGDVAIGYYNVEMDVAMGIRTREEAYDMHVPHLNPASMGARLVGSGLTGGLRMGSHNGPNTAVQDRIVQRVMGSAGREATDQAANRVMRETVDMTIGAADGGVQGGLMSMANGGSFAEGFAQGFVGGAASHGGQLAGERAGRRWNASAESNVRPSSPSSVELSPDLRQDLAADPSRPSGAIDLGTETRQPSSANGSQGGTARRGNTRHIPDNTPVTINGQKGWRVTQRLDDSGMMFVSHESGGIHRRVHIDELQVDGTPTRRTNDADTEITEIMPLRRDADDDTQFIPIDPQTGRPLRRSDADTEITEVTPRRQDADDETQFIRIDPRTGRPIRSGDTDVTAVTNRRQDAGDDTQFIPIDPRTGRPLLTTESTVDTTPVRRRRPEDLDAQELQTEIAGRHGVPADLRVVPDPQLSVFQRVGSGLIKPDTSMPNGTITETQARRWMNTVNEMQTTRTGQDTLRHIQDKGVTVRLEDHVGGFFNSGSNEIILGMNIRGRNNRAGVMAHEGGHSRNRDLVPDMQSSGRDTYLRGMNLDEARAQVLLFEHHLEQGRTPTEQGGYAEYASAYHAERQRLQQENPSMPRRELDQRARQHGVEQLAQWWGENTRPNQEAKTADGRAPTSYNDYYGSYWDRAHQGSQQQQQNPSALRGLQAPDGDATSARRQIANNSGTADPQDTTINGAEPAPFRPRRTPRVFDNPETSYRDRLQIP